MEETLNPTDSELIQIFQTDPERAWTLLLEKYASRVYGLFRHWGLEHGEAAECFSAMCRHLAGDDFRRLLAVDDLASRGSLFPWLRALARKFALRWTHSEQGQRRLRETVQDLTDFQKILFDLYFVEGCAPPEVRKRLPSEGGQELLLIDVLEQLDELFEVLSKESLWRLLSQLARSRRAKREQESVEGKGDAISASGSDQPQSQEFERLWQAWASLDARTALTLQLRFDDCQSIPQIALITGSSEDQVRGSLHSGLLRLRRSTSN